MLEIFIFFFKLIPTASIKRIVLTNSTIKVKILTRPTVKKYVTTKKAIQKICNLSVSRLIFRMVLYGVRISKILRRRTIRNDATKEEIFENLNLDTILE